MTTMKTVCDKYRYSKLAFFVVPVIGGFLSNITNAIIITWFINFCAAGLFKFNIKSTDQLQVVRAFYGQKG